MVDQPQSTKPDFDAQAEALGLRRPSHEEIHAMVRRAVVDQSKINRLFYAGDINKISQTIHRMNVAELNAVVDEAKEEIQERAEAGRMPLWRFAMIGAITSVLTVAVSYPLARILGATQKPFRDYMNHKASWAFMGGSTAVAPLSAYVDRRATNAPEILTLAQRELENRKRTIVTPEEQKLFETINNPKPQAVTDIAPEGPLVSAQKFTSF
jgi:hypothetical protein